VNTAANPADAGAPAGNALLIFLRKNTIVALLLLLVVLIIFIEIIRHGTVNPSWLSNNLLFSAPLGLFAAGQTLVILTGGIDLSVASVATGSAYLLATTADMGAAAGILIGMGLGLLVGIINGVGVAVLRVQPLVMTLGTGLMTAGAMTVYSQKVLASSPHVPEFLVAIGSGKIFHYVPIDLAVWIPLAIVMIFGLRRTGFGRLLYAIGDNREACKLAGIRVWQVLLVDYVLCSLLAAAAGLMLVGSTNAADLGLADIYLLPSIAAVIIGGTSIFGGRGGYSGAIIGSVILTVLNSLLTLLDSPEPIKQILYGAIILVLAAAYTRLTD
jgi:ribose transport system permease protein